MANLIEIDDWEAGIYQIEQTDPVLGGAPNVATGAGMSNIPHQQLAKRTTWLRQRVDELLDLVRSASTTVAGLVRIATKAEAEARLDNSAVMTPLRFEQALVAALTGIGAANITADGLFKNVTAVTINSGAIVPGTSLLTSSAGGGSVGLAPPGTWKCLSLAGAGEVGLFRRIL